MDTTVINATEYRNLPLDALTESPNNPRRTFDETALNELAESIKAQGILAPLVVRPVNNHFEIVAGARRYRAAQRAGLDSAPVRIVELTDAQALETGIVENLMRRDVHPLDEANGYARLIALDEPKYSIEQLAARVGKSPSYIATRLKLTELAPAVVAAFSKDEIGVGHALLLAKLQTAQQEQALAACYQETYGSGSQSKRILLPVRHLQQWIEHNVLLLLTGAPFSTKDAELVPDAGSCMNCPKRTGHNKLLFSEWAGQGQQCTDPACYQKKIDAHVAKTLAAKPKLVQISTAYGQQREGSAVIPRNRYVEIRQDKPQRKGQENAPEYKTCKFVSEAIVTEGSEKGAITKVCANPDCPVHHPKKQQQRTQQADVAVKAEQEKQRREEAIANTTGIRVLSAIGAAVPVRLMKRDLFFVAERLATLLDENRLAIVARQHGIKKGKDSDFIQKLFAAFLRRTEEGVLGGIVVELVILLAASRNNAAQVLRDAAAVYKVDTEAITAKVRQEFAAKEKAKTAKPTGKKTALKPPAKAQSKPAKKAAAA
jgi:ParB family chromosome partitioning protein